MAQGRLKQRSFETKEGEKRTVVELEVDEIGPSLRYATATVTKAARSGHGPGRGSTGGVAGGGGAVAGRGGAPLPPGTAGFGKGYPRTPLRPNSLRRPLVGTKK